MEEILFRETTTLGVRRYPAARHKLHRKEHTVQTPWGPVQGKLGWREGRPPVFSPEYEDCAAWRANRSVPLREVYERAQRAYQRLERDEEHGFADPRLIRHIRVPSAFY